MLLTLLIHQPQMLGSVLAHTPSWVWGLLASLAWLGGSQLANRTVGLRRTLLMPLVMTGLSIYGISSAFAGSPQIAATVVAWMAALAVVCALALWVRPRAPRGTLYTASTRQFFIPGSAVPLLLILSIFLTKYLVGVELAMQPALAHDSSFALQIAALYGMFNGFVAARSLRLWRLARQQATLANAALSA
jgi:hypothetical protein